MKKKSRRNTFKSFYETKRWFDVIFMEKKA